MESPKLMCPFCMNQDKTLISRVSTGALTKQKYYCDVCSKVFEVIDEPISQGHSRGTSS